MIQIVYFRRSTNLLIERMRTTVRLEVGYMDRRFIVNFWSWRNQQKAAQKLINHIAWVYGNDFDPSLLREVAEYQQYPSTRCAISVKVG